MSVRTLKPRPLVITPEETTWQRKAGRYICTATWGTAEEAAKVLSRPYRKSSAHPQHDGHLSRVGWWRDQAVGHVGVLRIAVRVGRVTLCAAGIAGVCVDPRARKQGIASALLQDALEKSKAAGISFSMLVGIPGFYHQFGFVPAMPAHRVLFLTDSLKDLPPLPRWTVWKARRGDIPQMMALHGPVYGNIDGGLVRDPRVFLRRKRDMNLILRGPDKGDRAYIVGRMAKIDDVEQLEIIEAGGCGSDWPMAVISWAASQAKRIGKDRVSFYLPSQHPICQQMIFCNAIERTEHASNAAVMACVLDFAGLAREMAPEWVVRVSGARVKAPREGLLVRFREQTFRWRVDRAGGRVVEVVARGARSVDVEFNDGLARLVMGYGSPEAVMRRYGIRATKRAAGILGAVFPERQPALSWVDSF